VAGFQLSIEAWANAKPIRHAEISKAQNSMSAAAWHMPETVFLAEFFWTESPPLGRLRADRGREDFAGVVDGMTEELARVGRDPNSVFFYAFIQARARAW